MKLLNKLFTTAIAVMLSTAFLSCSSMLQDTPPEEIAAQASQSESQYDSRQMAKIAEIIARLDLSKEICEEVHKASLEGLSKHIEESYYFKEILSDDSSKKYMTRGAKNNLGNLLRDFVSETRADYGVKEGDLDLYKLEESDLQIYWPYSEEWDGEETPVVTYFPLNPEQEWNWGYKKNGEGVERVKVDDEYAFQHPVWIVNEAEIAYTDALHYKPWDLTPVDSDPIILPNPNSGDGNNVNGVNSLGPGLTFNPVYTVFVGKFKSEKQYDSLFAGGSEFVIQMGNYQDMRITDLDKLLNNDPRVTYLKIFRSRGQIRKKEWVEFGTSAVLISNWYPESYDAGFMVYEEDQGGRQTWEASLTISLGGKDYGFKCSFPYKNGDDMIYKTTYNRNFIFSNGNKLAENAWNVFTSGGVYWTLPYKMYSAVPDL